MINGEKIQSAAVLVPLYRDNEKELRIIIIRRSQNGIHGGQLAFPGGKSEAGDTSMMETAIRETAEEIGIDRSAIEVITDLPVVESRNTGYIIHPFLAKVIPPSGWILQKGEIEEVLEIKIHTLPAMRKKGTVIFGKNNIKVRTDYYKIGPYKLWGISYRILHPHLPGLLSGDFNL